MQVLSIEAWAKRENVDPRKAYRWAKEGKIPTVLRKVTVRGIPETITKADLVNH